MRQPGSALAQPDAAILVGARSGDQRAFAVIVHAYERLVFTYIYRLVDVRRLAEDLTQDVFLRVFRGLPGFNESAAFTTWLFQIAKNRVVDELRAIERRPAAANIDEVALPMLVEARFEHAEPIEALWVAVAELNNSRVRKLNIAAPKAYGKGAKYKAIEPAPGRYVKAKA